MVPVVSRLLSIYERISLIYPDKPWMAIVEKILQMKNRFPMRTGQAELDNWLAFALARFERRQYEVRSGYEWKTMAEAFLYVDRVAYYCESVRNGFNGPVSLEKRFRGALSNPEDARAIRFELYMADLLSAQGCNIVWPLENEGYETFDLLVQPNNGLPEFELECKSFSGNKGVMVDMSDGQRLLEACMSLVPLHKLIPARPKMASIITVIVTNEIPKDENSLVRLANNIIAEIRGEKTTLDSSIFSIRHDFCDLIGDPNDADSCLEAASKLPGGMLAFVATGSNEEGWKGFQVSWAGKLTLWKKAERSGKGALDRQLTKKRPGAVALQFTNDSVESIWLSNNESNKFRKLAEKLFTREHAAMVVIASEINARPSHYLVPFRREAFMNVFCRFAAFDNQVGRYSNSKLKLLFGDQILVSK